MNISFNEVGTSNDGLFTYGRTGSLSKQAEEREDRGSYRTPLVVACSLGNELFQGSVELALDAECTAHDLIQSAVVKTTLPSICSDRLSFQA